MKKDHHDILGVSRDTSEQNETASPWIPKKTTINLVFITLIATVLRFYNIGYNSFWLDELLTVTQYVNHPVVDMFKILWPREMNMALFYLFAHFWMLLFSHPSEASLRALPALFSIATIPIVFLLGRAVAPEEKHADTVGFVAALLIALNAFNIQYAQEFRSYSLVFLLATLSTLLLIETVKRPNSLRLCIGYVFISAAMVYAHDYTILLIVAQAISLFILIITTKAYRFFWQEALMTYGEIGMLIIPMILAGHLAGINVLGWTWPLTWTGFITFAITLTGGDGIMLVWVYVIAMCAGILAYSMRKNRDVYKKWIGLLLLNSLILPIVIIQIISKLYLPLFVDRYFIFSLLPVVILAAVGIAWLLHAKNYVLKAGGSLLFILIILFSFVGAWNYLNWQWKEDWRGASTFMTTECAGPQDLRLYWTGWTATFAPFYNNQLVTQDQKLQDQIDNLNPSNAAALVPDIYNRVCLLVRPGSGQDLVEAALQTKYPKVIPTRTFIGLDLYIFEKSCASTSQTGYCLINQCESSSNDSQTSRSCTLGTVTSGDTIIIAIGVRTSIPPKLTDSGGNVYVTSTQLAWNYGSYNYIYYASNVRGGANFSVTSTFGASPYPFMAAFEYSGIAKKSPLDTATSTESTNHWGPTNFTSGASVTHAGDLIIGYAGCNDAAGVVSAVSPFTQIQYNPTGGCDIVESTVAGIAEPYSAEFNVSNNYDDMAGLMAAFKPALAQEAITGSKQP